LRVNCPGDELLGLDLSLLGAQVNVQVGLEVQVDIAGVMVVIPADCSTSGPPRAYLPSASSSTSSTDDAD
jgi:hypothetical protein